MSKLFKERSNSTKVNFDNNTPNLENINFICFSDVHPLEKLN